MGARLMFGALVLLAASGCSGKRAQLQAKAAADFKCGPEAIQTEGMAPYAYYEKASGCGKENFYVFDGTDWTSPADRAAFELSCDKQEIVVTKIDQTTMGVSGCGKKAVYVLLVSPVAPSKWVLNSEASGGGKGDEPGKGDAAPDADAPAASSTEKK